MSELSQAYARARHTMGNGHVEPENPKDDRLSRVLHRIEARMDDIDAKLSTLLTPLIQPTAQVFTTDETPRIKRRPHMREIISVVCRAYNVSDTDILSERRTQPIAHYRQIAMYLCCRLTFHGLPSIGRVFMRDHTTVLHARDIVAQKRNVDEELRKQLAALEQQLWPQGDVV